MRMRCSCCSNLIRSGGVLRTKCVLRDRKEFTNKICFRAIFTTSQNCASAVLQMSRKGPVMAIRMDRPAKKNAMNDQMWKGLTGALREADTSEWTKIITISGNEQFFCAGADLLEYRNATFSQFSTPESSIKSFAQNAAERLRNFAAAFIDCRKPIVALVEGTAIGIGVTMLPLCDIVYASGKATFTTPFTSLGLVPNCCSSYTIPKIVGYSRASKLLLMNETISARQAHSWGLVTNVFDFKNFQRETAKRVEELAELPVKALLHSKKLVREPEKKILHEVNKTEAQLTEILIQSPQVADAMQLFVTRKIRKFISEPS